MTELNHETFDLGQVLAGTKFPETEVDIFFDESIGFQIYRAQQALREAEIAGNEEELKQVQDRVEELKTQARDVKYTVTVRGVPESVRKNCAQKARDKFEVEYSLLNQELPNAQRDDLYNELLWNASLVKITDPKGAAAIPTEDHIRTLRTQVGRSVVGTINNAITELVEGSKSGFESAAQDPSFLSDASPEG